MQIIKPRARYIPECGHWMVYCDKVSAVDADGKTAWDWWYKRRYYVWRH